MLARTTFLYVLKDLLSQSLNPFAILRVLIIDGIDSGGPHAGLPVAESALHRQKLLEMPVQIPLDLVRLIIMRRCQNVYKLPIIQIGVHGLTGSLL